MLIETWESTTVGSPSGNEKVLKKTRTAIPIVRLGIRTGSSNNPSKIPLFFKVLLSIPKERAVPRMVEIVAEIKAIIALFIIAFLAKESLNSSKNHFHVKPLKGKL